MKQKKRVLIFGGKGFVGSAILPLLAKYEVYTVGPSPKEKNHKSCDIRDESAIETIIQKGDSVINLVGLSPTRIPTGGTYQELHVDGVKNIVSVAIKKKCHLIHMSALGASKNAPTEYLRTKGIGEEIVLAAPIKKTVVCPSVIFDKENELNKLIEQFLPYRCFPNIQARVQPVYRRDIAQIFVQAIKGTIKEEKIEVGGPEILSIFEMGKMIFIAQNRICIPIPTTFITLGMQFARFTSIGGISKDQITALSLDNTTKKTQSYVLLQRYSDWVKKTYGTSQGPGTDFVAADLDASY